MVEGDEPGEGDAASITPEDFMADRISVELARIIAAAGAGAKLPAERVLAGRLGVSRTALRDRLRLLESVGVLRRRTGSGTYVEPADPAVFTFLLNVAVLVSDLPLASLHSMRVAVERQAAREAAALADPVLLADVRKAMDGLREAADVPAAFDAHQRFHRALVRASGNPALVFFDAGLSGTLLRARRAQIEAGEVTGYDADTLVRTHERLYRALVDGDAAEVDAAADAHFAAHRPTAHLV